MKSYRVVYESETNRLVGRHCARGTRLPHTRPHLDEARRRIREALELFVDDAGKAPIVDDL